MTLVAKASTTVRNKNLIMVLMCAVFTAWFAYDGWKGYPAGNDRAVGLMIEQAKAGIGLTPAEAAMIESQWPAGGWNAASPELRDKVSEIAKSKNVAGWKSPWDIEFQKWLVLGLAVATIASTWWFLKCQSRRVIADDAALSPEKGVTVRWEDITKVDNRRWKKTGIVDFEYRDSAGQTQKGILDDYLVDGLIPILEQLAERSAQAEFINPPDEALGEAKD